MRDQLLDEVPQHVSLAHMVLNPEAFVERIFGFQPVAGC